MIKEIYGKSLLTVTKNPEAWFGVKYNMNIYRGCEHRCIYCDSRSECYQIDNFDDVHVKVNAIELLTKELKAKRKVGIIGTGAMSDPYTHTEKSYNLTGKALEVIAKYGFPVHIITKSDLIMKDIDTLVDINKAGATVAFTLTTLDEYKASRLEVGAPAPSRRLEAMRKLSEAGIYTGVTMMPILPFIEDNPEDVRNIVRASAEAGAKFIIPWFGLTLRDRQRAYFYNNLDKHFNGIRAKYEDKYGNSYFCESPRSKELMEIFKEEAEVYNIITSMKEYNKRFSDRQLSMF